MPHIVIAGSGPVGLATAIFLKQKYGNTVEVTVIDNNIDRYDRPGVIAVEALKTIESMGIPDLNVIESGSPPSIQIRDLQSELKKRAAESGVSLQPAKYQNISANSIITDPVIPDLNCDLLIDCTGERRLIMSQLAVPTELIGNNPVKNQFVAQIFMDETNAKKMKFLNDNDISPEKIRQFQSQTGWSELAPPWTDTLRKWIVDEEGTEKLFKYCLYCEVPEHIAKDPDSYKKYIHALLELKTGQPVSFEASTERGAFGPFEVQPKKLSQRVTSNGVIPIVALGDSMVSAEYHLGTGVGNGVTCAYQLVQSLEIHDAVININESKWQLEPLAIGPYRGSNTISLIENHQKRITGLYKSRRHEIAQGTILTFEKYTSLSNDQIDPVYLLSMAEKLQTITQDPLMSTKDREEAFIQGSQAFLRYHSITQDPKALELLSRHYAYAVPNLLLLKQSRVDYEYRLRLYQFALEISEICMPGQDWDNKTQLLAHSGQEYYHLKQYDKSLTALREAYQLAETHNLSSKFKDSIQANILFISKKVPATSVPAEVTKNKREQIQATRKNDGDAKEDSDNKFTT